jgi:mono/diheme cytochrome c family protein
MKKILFFSFVLITACTKKQAVSTNEMSPEQLVERGKAIYLANCIACHNVDPKIDGSVGPAVYGSSLELITERVMHAKYPAGYKPKKSSAVMVALPHLQAEIPALKAYLNSN